MGGSNLQITEGIEERVEAWNRVAVEGHNDVALLKARGCRRPARLEGDNQHPGTHAKLISLRQGQRLCSQSQVSAADPAVGPQALNHSSCPVDGERERHTAAVMPTVDADDPAFRIDQRTPGKAGQQLGGGMDQMMRLAASPASEWPGEPGHDAERYLVVAGVAERQHEMARANVRVLCADSLTDPSQEDVMRIRRGTVAARATLIGIGALIAIAASAVTAVAVRAGAGAAPTSAAVGAGSVAGPRDTVTVVGEGTQNATPDNALISLGVQVQRGSTGHAMNAANSEMNALLSAIKGQGVQDADIQTTGIGVNQQSNGFAVTGYQAFNTVNVKIHHISNAGSVISAAQHAVGDDIQLNGITLLLSDNTNQLKGARQTAMNAAAARAKEWAALASRHLGKVLSVSEIVGNGSAATPCYGQCGGGGGGPVQAGQVNVTVDVAVVYELTD